VRGLVPILTLVGGSIGCSAGVSETVPSGTLTQFDFGFTTEPVRRLLIFVVDDSSTADAASLRASASALLRSTFELTEGETGYLPSHGDPGARPPADLRVVVVHPSAVGPVRAIGPSDDPGLAYVSGESSTAEVDALADAVGRQIDAFVAPVGLEYALVDAASSSIDLVVGARPPTDAGEAALVASLGTPELVSLIVATSRDDGSSGPVRSLSVTAKDRFSAVVLSPLVADTSCRGVCGGGGLDPSTRLAAWAAGIGSLDVIDTACAGWQDGLSRPNLADPCIFADPFDDHCMPSPVARLPGGEAECSVQVSMPDDGPCASHPGMLDPRDRNVQQSRPITDAFGPKRVCEISELLGPQAESCRTSLDCAGCMPGWCATDVGGRSTLCPDADQFFLRFVEGAIPRERSTIRVVCDLQR